MRKRNKRQNSSTRNLLIGVIAVITIFIIAFFVLEAIYGETDKALNKEGYTTEDSEDPFYKKIVTNNTLDSYFDDVANNRDSSYEEYYLAKESLDFIELKMTYTNSMSTTLNIASNLRTKEVKFDYELSYNKVYLLINGTSKDNYSCEIVSQKNVSDNVIRDQCDKVMDEITIFLQRRDSLLLNEKVRELVDEPMKQYIEQDN